MTTVAVHGWFEEPAPDLEVARIREETLFARPVGEPSARRKPKTPAVDPD